jgi:hypothetical protein
LKCQVLASILKAAAEFDLLNWSHFTGQIVRRRSRMCTDVLSGLKSAENRRLRARPAEKSAPTGKSGDNAFLAPDSLHPMT